MFFPLQCKIVVFCGIPYQLHLSLEPDWRSQTGSDHCNNFLQKNNNNNTPPKKTPKPNETKETKKPTTVRNKFKISIFAIQRTSRPESYILAFRNSIHRLSWLHIPQVADGTCTGVHEVALRASLQSTKNHERWCFLHHVWTDGNQSFCMTAHSAGVLNAKPSCSEM